jgi:hypothetical protein
MPNQMQQFDDDDIEMGDVSIGVLSDDDGVHMSVGSGGNEIFVRLDHDEARDVAMLLLTAARGIN